MVTTPTLWKVETQANVADAGLQQLEPQIVALQDGGFFVLWTDRSLVHNPGGGAIVGRFFNPLGAARTGEIELSDDGEFYGASVALNPTVNRLRVAYVSEQVGDDAIVSRRFNPLNGALAGSDSGVPTAGEEPHIAAGAVESGGSFFVHTRGSGADTDIVGARGNGAFPYDIHDEPDRSDFAQVAGLENDKYVVVWQDEDDGDSANHNIEFALFAFDDNAPFVGPLSVAGASASADETAPDVTGLTGGGFVVTWHEPSAIRATIYTSAGLLVTSDISVDTGTSTGARVTELADGGFIVNWADTAAGTTLGQRFSAAGAKIGGNFIINATAGTVEGTLLADGRVAFVTVDTAGADSDVMISIWDPRTGPITGTTGNDALTARREGSTVNGLAGSDKMWGLGGNDTMDGGAGVDLMVGAGGDDRYFVDNVGDKALENAGQGNDSVLTSVSHTLSAASHIEIFSTTSISGTSALTLRGNELDQRINGNNGNNVLAGGAGDDLLVGYAGNDNLEGQSGADTLKGVSGADKFVFRQSLVATSGADHIADFGSDDLIFFDHPSVTGPLNPAAFVVGANALDANDRFIYYAPYNALYFDQDGNGAAAKVLFAVFDNGYVPTAADIVLF